MFKCPNCKNKSISKWSKFFLGPIRSIKCSQCGCRISIPYKSLYWMILYIIFAFVMLKSIIINQYKILVFILLTTIVIYLFYRFIPLVVKLERKDTEYKVQKRNNLLIGISCFLFTFLSIFIITKNNL